MSGHWKPEPSVTRLRPARTGSRVLAAGEATPWTRPQSYVAGAPGTWSDGMKAAAVLAAGACVLIAAGFAQAL